MRDAELEMLARLARDMEAYDMEEDGMAGQYGMEGAGVAERKIDLYAALGVEEDADLEALKLLEVLLGCVECRLALGDAGQGRLQVRDALHTYSTYNTRITHYITCGPGTPPGALGAGPRRART